MAPNNMPTTNTTISNEEETSIDSKRASSTSPQRGQDHHQPQQPAEVLKCPRCDSMKTKFCYYNNYSLTQPRHFCKTCRRYWTKGGALRNVPIGGGCRKNKKLKSSTSDTSIDNSSTSASLDLGGLKFLHGLSPSPAMDFQLGGLSLPRLNLNSSPSSGILYNQFSNSFGDIIGSSAPLPTPSSFNLDNPYLSFNFSSPPLFKQQSGNNVSLGGDGNQELGYFGSNLEFPWKFQQQKFVDLLSSNDNNINLNMNTASQALSPTFLENYQQIQRPQPIMFQNFDISPRTNGFSYGDNPRKEGPNGNFVSGYFFEETFAPTTNPTTSTITSNGENKGNENGVNWNNGSQAWGNLDQFGRLP